MRNTIVYRHWQPGDDDAVLAFRPVNEDWFRHKFDDENLEPEGIRLAFLNERVVGHVMGERTTLCIEGKVQEFRGGYGCLCGSRTCADKVLQPA